MILVLHNIRSVHNVGSIFRTADAAGVSKIILCGYTPAPVDRFQRLRPDFVKVSLGAEQSVPWERAARLAPVLRILQKEGHIIAALEQSARSVPLFSWQNSHDKTTLVVGNEVRGLSRQALAHADVVLEIPMRGTKESLNVSVAAGIALFALLH